MEKSKFRVAVKLRGGAIFILFGGALVGLANMSIETARAEDAKAAERVASLGFSSLDRDLETRIWNGDEGFLGSIESEVVHTIQTYPKSSYAHYLLAHLYVRRFSQNPGEMQILKTASELAEQAVELDPGSDLGYLAMADILDLMGQTSKAITLLQTAKRSGMKITWRYHFHMARLQLDTLTAEEVLAIFEEALRSDSVRPDIVIPYVIAVLQSSYQGVDLLNSFSRWNEKFSNNLFRQSIAVCLADLNKFHEAHLMYQMIAKSDPQMKEAVINDAILLYKHLGKPKEAIKIMEHALETQGRNFDKSSLATINAHLGAAYARTADFPKARTAWIESFRLGGNNLALLDFVSAALKSEKRYSELVTFIRELGNERPGVGHAYAIMGQTLSEDLKRHKDAVDAYDNAIILDPLRSDFRTGLGLAYYRLSNLEAALEQFSAAVKIDPNDATAKYNEACVLAKLGRNDQSLAALQEALNLDPRLQETARTDSDFASIQKSTRFQAIVDGVKGKVDENVAH